MAKNDLNVLVTKNDGQQIVSTNYWAMPRAAAGLLFLSERAGAVRLLMPATIADAYLQETADADRAAVTLAGANSVNRVHVLWENGTDTPFVMSLDPRQYDCALPRSAAGQWTTLAIYVPGIDGMESVRCVRTLPVLLRAASKQIDMTKVPAHDASGIGVELSLKPTDDIRDGACPASLPGVSGPALHEIPTRADIQMTRLAKCGRIRCEEPVSILKALQAENPIWAGECIVLGGDVNEIDRNGDSPLHYAAARGNEDIIRALLARGAAVETANRRGQTPIVRAIHFRHFGSAKLLWRVQRTRISFGDAELTDLVAELCSAGMDVTLPNCSGFFQKNSPLPYSHHPRA